MTPPRRASESSGQATVEFALALPFVVIVLLAIAQIGVIVRNEVALRHAAREGARAAAVSTEPARAARAAVDRALDLPVTVSVVSSGHTVAVTVTYVDPTDVSIIGAAIGPVTQVATATMATEPPPTGS